MYSTSWIILIVFFTTPIQSVKPAKALNTNLNYDNASSSVSGPNQVNGSQVPSISFINNSKSTKPAAKNTRNGPLQLPVDSSTVINMIHNMGREHAGEAREGPGNSVMGSSSTMDNTFFTRNKTPDDSLGISALPHGDGKKIVPKKGAPSSDISETVDATQKPAASAGAPSNSSIKKPLITVSDSDYEDITKSKSVSIDQSMIDPLMLGQKNNRADYIVPIVAIILSVPLVAILISIIYKKSADWWQHRNYKRMDFLIEGMYHN